VNDAIAARQDLAAALAASGQLQGAVDELRRAQRAADSIGAALDARAGLALARADLAAQLNAYGDADRLYANALTLYRKASDRAGEAEAQHGRGIVLLARGERTRARELLAAALVTQQATGNQRGASLTRMSLAELSFDEGDTTAARRQFARAAAELDHLGDPIGTAAALGERAAMEATIRMPATAESLFAAALAKVGVRPAPNVTWLLHAGLGSVRQREGALDDAARELRASISDIEHAQMTLAAPERRSAFLADKADVYLQLALLERARGRTGAAFELSERTRAREMLEMLSQGRIATPAVAGEVVEREQDLRRRIAELTRAVEVSTPSTQPLRGPEASSASAVAREALSRAQHDYGDLLLEMRERAPTHAALLSTEGANVRDVARNLSPQDAFIEYLVSDTASLAFVITRDTVAIANLEIGRHALAKLIDFVHGTLRPRGNPRLDSLWRAPLRELHARLILPLEESGLLKGKTRLILVPQAELNYLPFAALVAGLTQRFLVERYEIVMTPSASVWLALAARGARRPGSGCCARTKPAALWRHRRSPRCFVGRCGCRVLVGNEATEDVSRERVARVLHLATFGTSTDRIRCLVCRPAPGLARVGRLVHGCSGSRSAQTSSCYLRRAAPARVRWATCRLAKMIGGAGAGVPARRCGTGHGEPVGGGRSSNRGAHGAVLSSVRGQGIGSECARRCATSPHCGRIDLPSVLLGRIPDRWRAMIA
jgi:tetratricopeptide (TPR) repeat protein